MKTFNGKSHTRSGRITFVDLFSGIGGIRIGLERAGAECVFSSEWDESARKSYETYFGDTPAGDITQIDASLIPDHSILAGGFPCQAFSILGDKRGFSDTRGTLFFEIERIAKHKKPRAVLLENVRHLVSHNKGNTFSTIVEKLQALGYSVHWRILNALDYGLPQKRERVIIVGLLGGGGFQWPPKRNARRSLKNLLEDDQKVDRKYFASREVQQSIKKRLRGKNLPREPWICHENKSGNVSALPYSCALRAGASYNYLLVNGRRRLTPREQLRLQGFPEDFPIVVSDAAIRKQTGNSVPVNMIASVAKELVKTLRDHESPFV